MRCSFFTTCLVLCSFFWVFQSLADQNDPDLDSLFTALLKTEDREQGNIITDEIWKRWLLVDDSEIRNLLSIGISAMNQNNLIVALNLFDKVVDKEPSFSEGWNKRATAYYLLGDYRNSIADIQQTLQLESRHFGAMAGLAWILLEQGNYEMAELVMKKTLAVNPFLIDVQRELRILKNWKDKKSIKFRLNLKESDATDI